MKAKFILSDNVKQVERIRVALFKNKDKYGYEYCPCVAKNAYSVDTICPCKEYRETGICHCKMYKE